MNHASTTAQPQEGSSSGALREQRDSSMLLGTFAATHSGLTSGANTDWTLLDAEASENACDACRLHGTQCMRSHISEMCWHCREKELECAGPGAARHAQSFETVDQTLFDAAPVDGEYEVGQSVTVRNDLQQWDRTAHVVKRVIYRPVAIVLDNDNNTPIPIEDVRPYPDRWPNDESVQFDTAREFSIDPALMAKMED